MPGALSAYSPGVIHTYPPLNLEARTPRLTLAGATDELLERLVPVVRAGVADAAPWPFDDPMSLYADSPDREWRWLRAIWAGRARVDQSFWRLYFVVLLEGDAQKQGERHVAALHHPTADLLRVGHHGSANATTPELLESAKPRFAVISVGSRNLFGLPRIEVLARLQSF